MTIRMLLFSGCGVVCVDLMCGLNARKEQKKRGKNSQLCQQHGPKLLAKPTRASGGKPSFANSQGQSCWQSYRSLCQPDFANRRRFPVGEGNGI
jgi:hypothetical protein